MMFHHENQVNEDDLERTVIENVPQDNSLNDSVIEINHQEDKLEATEVKSPNETESQEEPDQAEFLPNLEPQIEEKATNEEPSEEIPQLHDIAESEGNRSVNDSDSSADTDINSEPEMIESSPEHVIEDSQEDPQEDVSESDGEDNQNDSGDLQILSYHDSNPAATQPFETGQAMSQAHPFFQSQGSISNLYVKRGYYIRKYNLYANKICNLLIPRITLQIA